jgi:hypothetical protein
MRPAWGIAGLWIAVACSSGSSGVTSDAGSDGGYNGPVGEAGTPCDAANAGRDCSLSMPASGGLTGTLDGEAGCGEGSGTGGDLSWTGTTLGARVTATFTGAVPTATGTVTLASLQISTPGADGSVASWTAPSGTCSITLSSVQTECQSAFRKWSLIVSGTGTCNGPASPDSGNGAAPVTIGTFQFSHWL